MASVHTCIRKKCCRLARITLLLMFSLGFSVSAFGATYDNGVFQFDDPGGLYSIRFEFDNQYGHPLPLSCEMRPEVHPTSPGVQQDVHRFNLPEPYSLTCHTWQVTGKLASTIVLKRTNDFWSGWTAVTAHPDTPIFMQMGTFYSLEFRVSDPSQFSGARQIYFYFALARQTYPPVIDMFSVYPTAIEPGETVEFTCEAHDAGTWGSEYLIFKLDVNNDGVYDHEELGVLKPGEEDAFRGVRRVQVSIKYNNPKIYEAVCTIENDRGETTVSAPLSISVGYARLGVVGRPNDPGDLETAIIPPDERFPARYSLTLTDPEGTPLQNESLTVSIDNTPQARLQGSGDSGSQITITTDEQGKAEFTYAFLDIPPAGAPILDDIVIESVSLGIRKTVKVSVGLKLRVSDVVKGWDSGTTVPRDLSLRIQVTDAFRPGMNLEEYIANLKFTTGQHLGVAVTTWWLNRPEPDTLQWIANNIKGFESPPDDILYTNGRGWIKKIDDQFIVNVIDPPLRSVGLNTLPTLTLNGEGLHIFELKVEPVILPEETGDLTLTLVKSAPTFPFFFGVEVYGAESTFKSLVCAFSPTDAEQFLLKTVVLDCPLLKNAAWVGSWASGTAIPYVLLVTEVASLACDFMEGKYLAVGAALAGKYLSRLDSLQQSGAITLTEQELYLLKKGLVSKSIKKFYDTYNNSVKHFLAESDPQSLRTPLKAISPKETLEWPDSLSLSDMTQAIESLSVGVISVPQMQGLEALAIVSSGQVSIEQIPTAGMVLEDEEVNFLLYETGGPSPVISTAADTTLFHISNLSVRDATLNRYEVVSSGENMELFFADGKEELAVDLDGDGQPDGFIYPQSMVGCHFLMGDVDRDGTIGLRDGMLVLQALTGLNTTQELILPWAVDVNGDGKIGTEEAIYILQSIGELK